MSNSWDQRDRKKKRRAVLPGFPVEFKFTNYSDLSEYFGGSRITCLRCGKEYRTLGVHLKSIHGIEPDEYRDMYGIPWTYGLSCAATSSLHSEIAKDNFISGKWVATAEKALALRGLPHRSRVAVRDETFWLNLKKMNAGKSGEEAARRKGQSRRGTPEFREKMLNRPQCQREFQEAHGIIGWWKGKKQSPEHIAKRTVKVKSREDGKDGLA